MLKLIVIVYLGLGFLSGATISHLGAPNQMIGWGPLLGFNAALLALVVFGMIYSRQRGAFLNLGPLLWLVFTAGLYIIGFIAGIVFTH